MYVTDVAQANAQRVTTFYSQWPVAKAVACALPAGRTLPSFTPDVTRTHIYTYPNACASAHTHPWLHVHVLQARAGAGRSVESRLDLTS